MAEADRKQLFSWLIRQLQPLSETNPTVLGKFVLQLLISEKGEKEIRADCVRELDLYLSDATHRFVDKLFDALKTGSFKSEKQQAAANEDDADDGEVTSARRRGGRRRGRHGNDEDDEDEDAGDEDDYGGGRRRGRNRYDDAEMDEG